MEAFPKNRQFDVIIIGAGPSGMTASIYAARRELNTLVICGEVGGEMRWNSKIDFCTGVTQATLPKILEMFQEHIESHEYRIQLCNGEKVFSVQKKEGGFVVETTIQNTFFCKTLIIGVGKVPKMLDIPGEEVAIHGKGMSICQSSDVPLYRGKKMVVLGGGDAAMDVCLQLSRLTDSIVLMTDLDWLSGNKNRIQKVAEHPNIIVKKNITVQEILLDENKRVNGIRYLQEKEEKVYLCEGIFKEVGHVPDTGFLQNFLHLNERGEIPTNRLCQTEYPGLFAAGSCTDQPHKQPIVSVGEGAVAAMEAHSYLQSV